MIALFHGDAPFGWAGFVFAILMVLALVIIIEELARGTLARKANLTQRRKDAKKGR